MINKNIFNISAICLLGAVSHINAQSGLAVYGSTYVGAKGQLGIVNANAQLTTSVQTQRSNNIGKISVDQNSGFTGIGANAFIDGYVRSYKTGAFVFPVGISSFYRPTTINLQSSESVDVAYYNSTYSSLVYGENVFQVSNKEYWDILGQNKGVVTLSWDNNSAISSLITSLSDLGIVGWDGSKWVAIPAVQTSGSTISTGSLETKSSIDFSDYSAFTFAKIDNEALTTKNISNVKTLIALNDNKFVINSSEAYSKAEIYEISGKRIQLYAFYNEKSSNREFPYNKGVYIVKLTYSKGNVITKKIMHR